MQGLVNFADQVALIIAVILPAFFYCSAIAWFVFGAWGLWQMSQPHNPFRGKPWVPILSIVLSGVCATFDGFLTRANRTGGSDVTVGLSSSLTSYENPASPTSIAGQSPGDAINNTVAIFYLFFACFGAACAFAALSSWRASVNGATNRSRMGCGVQFVFGVMLINIKTIVAWLVSNWTT